MNQEVVCRIQLAEEREELADMLRRRRDLVVTGDMDVVEPEPQMSPLVVRSKLGEPVVRIEKTDDTRRSVALDLQRQVLGGRRGRRPFPPRPLYLSQAHDPISFDDDL